MRPLFVLVILASLIMSSVAYAAIGVIEVDNHPEQYDSIRTGMKLVYERYEPEQVYFTIEICRAYAHGAFEAALELQMDSRESGLSELSLAVDYLVCGKASPEMIGVPQQLFDAATEVALERETRLALAKLQVNGYSDKKFETLMDLMHLTGLTPRDLGTSRRDLMAFRRWARRAMRQAGH